MVNVTCCRTTIELCYVEMIIKHLLLLLTCPKVIDEMPNAPTIYNENVSKGLLLISRTIPKPCRKISGSGPAAGKTMVCIVKSMTGDDISCHWSGRKTWGRNGTSQQICRCSEFLFVLENHLVFHSLVQKERRTLTSYSMTAPQLNSSRCLKRHLAAARLLNVKKWMNE